VVAAPVSGRRPEADDDTYLSDQKTCALTQTSVDEVGSSKNPR